MPKLLEMREVDGDVWVKVGKPGDFPSGIRLVTPLEMTKMRVSWSQYVLDECVKSLNKVVI